MGLVGQAPAFEHLRTRLRKLAGAEGPVLISGETGTGEELVAHAIHRMSRRKNNPFVAVNCGSLMDSLLESELFGHERGAFTDAHTRRPGLMAQAAGGTLFLDEVDTLTTRGQVALLRALQDRSFRPLGSTTEHRVDVRFLAATNARLDRLVDSGAFRVDVYYRLSVFSVALPPLRERREDILPLVLHFVRKYAGGSRPALELSPTAVEALITWSWPGNVRELESAIMRAIPLSDGGRIVAADLGLPGVSGCADAEEIPDGIRTFKSQKRHILEVFERQYLTRLTTEHCGNVSRAARAAGTERRDLGKLLKRHGLDARWFAGQVAGGEFIPARPRNPAGSPVFGRRSKVADGSEPIGILPNDLSGTIVKTRLDSRFAQLAKKDWNHWCDFEDGMNEVFRGLVSSLPVGDQRLAMLCTYPLAGCGAPQILDVVRTHQFVLARRCGNWDIVETAGLKQAKAEIARLNEELEQRVVERADQLRQASEALRETQADLAHVNRVTAMGQLAASITHEVMQPIAPGIINAQAALHWLDAEPPNLGEARESLEYAVNEGNRAIDVIGRIRALIKKAPPRQEAFDIDAAIREVVGLTRGELVKNNISIRTQLTEGLPRLQGDKVQLQQLILNLIINAVEAMSSVPEGSRELVISTAKDVNGVLVAVRDAGPGLTPESIDRLFDAFYTTKADGMGMGLSICHSIVEAHGGRIWASRDFGQGATFQFTMPLPGA